LKKRSIILYIIGCIYILTLANSCEKAKVDDNITPTETRTLTVKPFNGNIGFKSGTFSISIISNTGISWSASSDQDWLKLSTTSGVNDDTIIVNYTANPTSLKRYATITIATAGITVLSKRITQNRSLNNPIVFNPDLTYGTVTDVQGNSYKTITIGTQTWMAENLRSTLYPDGTPIPLVEGKENWDALSANDKAYCWFYDDSATYNYPYGVMYTWAAAMNGEAGSSSNPSGVQGVCPDGWHVPSDDEWTTLETYLGGSTSAAIKLKETGLTHWLEEGATNESGFTALPGGFRNGGGTLYNIGYSGHWWSSTESYSFVYERYITPYNAELVKFSTYKDEGLYLRCAKDF
jgi:uncharacterized protein (TIGR02145 family)